MFAIKRIGTAIEAYALRWGSPDEPDRSPTKDYFTPATDLMLNAWGWPRPILYEHTITADGERAGAVGQWLRAVKDTIGVKLFGRLDDGHPMYPQIARDIDQGKMFLSSDSAPHLVRRRPAAKGTNEVTRWALLTASLTRNPAEHRLLPVAAVKALALKAGARHSMSDQQAIQSAHDALVTAGAVCGQPTKADDRARRLLLELDLELLDYEREQRILAELEELL